MDLLPGAASLNGASGFGIVSCSSCMLRCSHDGDVDDDDAVVDDGGVVVVVSLRMLLMMLQAFFS